MVILNGSVFTLGEGFVDKDVVIEEGRFTGGQRGPLKGEPVLDAAGSYVIPGLVDVHFHGCAGADFSDGTGEALETIGRYELQNGITSICPASMTLSEDMLVSVCETAWRYQTQDKKEPAARLRGIHLEGPFLSMEKKGAQNPAFIKKPDVGMFLRLQEAAHGLVRLMTVAPETEGAGELIRTLASKVHISVGHTACDYDTAYQAFSLGADHVTHCFNAMSGFSHRAPGVFGAAADCPHVMPELICDGLHVAPSAVRVVFGLFGKERVVLVSDSMRAAGMADGEYTLGGLLVKVEGRLATLEDGTIAGSVTNLMDCMRTAAAMGIPLETAVRCATYNPAKSIGMEQVCGSIEAGMDADCVVLSKEDLSVREVVFGGQIITGCQYW